MEKICKQFQSIPQGWSSLDKQTQNIIERTISVLTDGLPPKSEVAIITNKNAEPYALEIRPGKSYIEFR